MNCSEINGHKISKLTLGTVQLGIPYGINNTHGMPTFDESSRILQTALDSGIVSFDTARGYGESESVLGRFFSQTNAEKTIMTKVRFADETTDEIHDSLFAQAKDSAAKLGYDRLPFLMLHSEAFIDRYGKNLLDAMCDLKKEGIVENIGISILDSKRMDEILDSGIFNYVQIAQNMLDSSVITSGK